MKDCMPIKATQVPAGIMLDPAQDAPLDQRWCLIKTLKPARPDGPAKIASKHRIVHGLIRSNSDITLINQLYLTEGKRTKSLHSR